MNLILQLIREAIDMKLIIQWAITSSVLILIVLAARFFLKDRLSARLKYALWGVVLLRLLVPFQVELPAPVSDSLPMLAANLAQDITPRLDDAMLYAVPIEGQPTDKAPAGLPPQYARNGLYDDWEYYSGGIVYDGGHVTRYAFMMTALEVVVLIWIAGTALAALVILISNLRFGLSLRKRRKPLESVSQGAAGGLYPPLQAVPVYTVEGLLSPCLFGVIRPAVYLNPGAADNPDTLRHVLAHELTHYRHRDHIWSLLRCLALALHWYNPLVWLAVGLSKQDGELACDEGAITRLGEGERIPYGRTLVNMVAARSLRPGDLLSVSTAMTGGKKSIQQRVAQIVKKPETVKTAFFAAVSVVVLAAVFVFAGRGQPQPNTMFLSLLEQTTAIQYIPTAYSSRVYPVPITDEDLLTQARERLSTFTYLREDDPYPDLSGLSPYQNPKIVLTCGENETEYTLMWQNNYTYLFLGDLWEQQEELVKEEGETARLVGVSGTMRSQPGDRVFSAVAELALQQFARTEKTMITPGVTPELEEFFTQLEAAQFIYVDQPSLSSANPPGLIDHPKALIQAKQLLSKTRPVAYLENIGWEELSLDSNHPPEPITQEELEQQFFIGGYPLVLYPGSQQDSETAWLVPWNTLCLLVQWYPEREENTVEILASLPGNTIAQLQELAWVPDNIPPIRRESFLEQTEGAVSIQVQTGDGELTAITDPRRLEEARAALLSLAPLPDDVNILTSASEEELRRAVGGGFYAITLTDEAGGTVTYYINRRPMSNVDYLVLPISEYPAEDTQKIASFCRVGVLPGEANYNLFLATLPDNVYNQRAEPARDEEPDRVHPVTGN